MQPSQISMDDLPGPKPSLPFIGTSWLYFPIIGRYRLDRLHEANLDKYYRYGRISREEYVSNRPLVNVYDPDDIEKVLRSQGKFPRRPPNEAAVIFRNSHPELYSTVGLVNAAGEEWHRLRSSLTGLIVQPRVVTDFLPHQLSICDDLVGLLKHLTLSDGTVHNVIEPLHRMALESTTMLCLDTRLGCLKGEVEDGSDARTMIDASLSLFKAYQSLYYGSQLWRYVTTAAYKQMADAELTLYRVVSKYIMEVKALRMKDDQCPSMLQLLLNAQGIDFKDIHTGIVDMITAGIDTSANSISFVLYQLARNPHAQQRLYDEIESVVGGGEITTRTLQMMPFLKACVKETFRLCPTIPNIVRILTEDLHLSGYLIPEGTTVVCQTMASSQLKDYVDRATEFLPERWLPGEQFHSRCHLFTLQPFGCGPRMCPGRRFAEQEIYLTLIKIIQLFRVEFVKEMEMQYLFIITPTPPLTLRFVPRY